MVTISMEQFNIVKAGQRRQLQRKKVVHVKNGMVIANTEQLISMNCMIRIKKLKKVEI